MWIQREIRLAARARGFHLVTGEVLEPLPELASVAIGMLHLLIRHTSVPEDASYWTHTLEGPDDMPAHIKAALLGPTLSLPITRGALALGTWQGIYLCEHRDRGGKRSIVATIHGE